MVALDVNCLGSACALARQLRGAAGLLKVGSQIFTSEGPQAIKKLAGLGFGIFLDLKFHDIPNTVAGSVAAASAISGVRMMTLHATGGLSMMRAAREAAGDKKNRPALLGVTILTSLDASSLRQIGIAGTPGARALALAGMAKEAGLDGVVASAHEASGIRRACGPKFLIVVAGVRPSSADVNDQSRVATPAQAIQAGADYLVIGRPITGAKNPRVAAMGIDEEIAAARSSR